MTETTTVPTLRWGILGPGGIAHRFAAELDHSATGRLTAVGSRSADRARAFVDEVAPGRDVVAVEGYDELLARDDVDAVYLSTVHPEHARWAIAAVRAGKHVLCEKPLTVNHAEAMVVLEEARRSGVFVAEAFMYRHHPRFQRVLDLIAAGEIGDLLHIASSFSYAADVPGDHRLRDPRQAGGGILDVGGYPVSVACAIVQAAGGSPDPTGFRAGGTVGSTGTDEWAVADLVFASGATAHLECGTALTVPDRIEVVGSAGIVRVPVPWLPDPEAPSVIEVHRVGRGLETIEIPAAHQYAAQADEVARCIRAGEVQTPAIDWADSLGIATVLDRWRGALGVVYPFERADATVPTVSRHPLAVRADATMPYGSLPGIATRMSRLVLGCDNQLTLPHAAAMFDDWVERGGTAFDTGWLYAGGLMERLLGRWMATRGIRDDVVVIGKGAHTPHCDPESLTRQLLETLDRLGTDHLDLYLMHRDNLDVPVGEFVDVLDEHARAGRVHAFGGSNWTIERFAAANAYAAEHDRQGFAALSNHFGLARALDVPWAGCEHVTDPESRAWLERTNTPLLPWSSQARGFFARADPKDTSDAELVRCYYSDDNFERLARARALAAERGVAPTAIALAYVLAQPFPTFPLIGPRSIAETRVSLEGLAIDLTPEDVAWLDLRNDTRPR